MIYIKLEDDMSLMTTVWEPIYRGDHLCRKITYLLPLELDDVDLLTAAVYLSYIRADGVADVVLLDRQEEMYNEAYLQYTLPVTCKLSRHAGEVCTWLQICSGPVSEPVMMKSGENILQIMDAKDLDDYAGDRQITALYQMQKKLEAANRSIEMLNMHKADNVIFDPETNTLQLAANGEPVGDAITMIDEENRTIQEMRLSTDGELLVFFTDDSIQNLGKVTGDTGPVYVPHVDAHKVLTYTLEKEPPVDGVNIEVDLDPQDDWGSVDEFDSMDDENSVGMKTKFIWEEGIQSG